MPTLFQKIARQVLTRLPETGTGRLIDRSVLARSRFAEATLLIRCRGGEVVRANPNDLIGRHLYFRGTFDPVVREALVRLAPPGCVFWDVGANIGYMSCCVLRSVPGSRVVAVEPLPDIHDLLRENLDRAGADRAMAVRAAIADSEGTASMVRRPGNSGASHLLTPGEAASSVTDTVRLASAEELLRVTPGGRVDVMKVDVEGHELGVFRSMTGLAAEHWPAAIVFEHHRADGSLCGEIAGLLEERGYTVWRLCKSVRDWVVAPLGSPAPHGYTATADFLASRGEEPLRRLGRAYRPSPHARRDSEHHA